MKYKMDDKRSLHQLLFVITGIGVQVVKRPQATASTSIAKRMSWAATRGTKRVEDRACSTLGILQVNMPMLYGERQKAFTGLQEKIIKDSNDQSLFTWERFNDPDLDRGLLAESSRLHRLWHVFQI